MTTAPIPATTRYRCLRCLQWTTLHGPCACQPPRAWWRPVDRRSFALGGLVFTLLYGLITLYLTW